MAQSVLRGGQFSREYCTKHNSSHLHVGKITSKYLPKRQTIALADVFPFTQEGDKQRPWKNKKQFKTLKNKGSMQVIR